MRRLSGIACLGAASVIAFDAAGCDLRVMVSDVICQSLVIVGCFISIVVYCRTSDDTIPSQHIRDLLVGVAFCSTVAWLDLLASETVAVLETVGAAVGLSSAVLGVTALAWGNCIGDFGGRHGRGTSGQSPDGRRVGLQQRPSSARPWPSACPWLCIRTRKGLLAVDLTGQAILS